MLITLITGYSCIYRIHEPQAFRVAQHRLVLKICVFSVCGGSVGV